MKKEYKILDVKVVYLSSTDIITASEDYPDAPEDNDIIGDDIF